MDNRKLKKCRFSECGKMFAPYQTTQVVCSGSIVCALGYAEEKKAKKFKSETREMKREFRAKDRSYQIKKAQDKCNEYIRFRDTGGCISCDKPATWGGQWHASHYRPAGNCSSLRFHPMNIHKACSECNNFKSGNLVEFRIRLIDKIGLKWVEWLESQNQAHKWDIDDLKDIYGYYANALKQLQRESI